MTRAVRVRAFAKINVSLRILGTRPDGYHELRTVFQTIALHDTLTLTRRPGPFEIECDEARCPTDGTNLVWRAAERLWQHAGRRGALRDTHVRIAKRIPLEGGLGGGSSDAAAALRGLAALWRIKTDGATLLDVGRSLGADVPFFFEGGVSLGVERGDVLFPLAERPDTWVVLVMPSFGVSTRDAYAWWDASPPSDVAPIDGRHARRYLLPASELRNDLEAPVSRSHPEIGRLTAAIRRLGAAYSAMSGSGSTIFGLFQTQAAARKAAGALRDASTSTLVSRTLGRVRYRTSARPF